jgi:hypothetical protein
MFYKEKFPVLCYNGKHNMKLHYTFMFTIYIGSGSLTLLAVGMPAYTLIEECSRYTSKIVVYFWTTYAHKY